MKSTPRTVVFPTRIPPTLEPMAKANKKAATAVRGVVGRANLGERVQREKMYNCVYVYMNVSVYGERMYLHR